MHRRRIEKLIVVDDEYRAVGLITVKDMDKARRIPDADKDDQGRLLVGAASTVGDGVTSARLALVDAGVDVIVVDTAHGHSIGVLAPVERIKRDRTTVQIVAGNVATSEGAMALIDAGADAIKVGHRPGLHLHDPRGGRRGRAPAHCDRGNAPAARARPVCRLSRTAASNYSGDIAKAIARRRRTAS